MRMDLATYAIARVLQNVCIALMKYKKAVAWLVICGPCTEIAVTQYL